MMCLFVATPAACVTQPDGRPGDHLVNGSPVGRVGVKHQATGLVFLDIRICSCPKMPAGMPDTVSAG